MIRQAFYSSATREWRADIDYLVASDARKYTPIAVINAPDSWDQRNGYINYGGVSASSHLLKSSISQQSNSV